MLLRSDHPLIRVAMIQYRSLLLTLTMFGSLEPGQNDHLQNLKKTRQSYENMDVTTVDRIKRVPVQSNLC